LRKSNQAPRTSFVERARNARVGRAFARPAAARRLLERESMFHEQSRRSGHDVCDLCHQRYPISLEFRCAACDAAVCPICIELHCDREPLCTDCARLLDLESA
jgi:hypothetical protein